MSEGPLFEWLSNQLEQATAMSRLAARGTVRLLLKDVGLTPDTLSRDHLAHLVTPGALGKALRSRGVEDADQICRDLATRIDDRDRQGREKTESPEDIFKRLGWS